MGYESNFTEKIYDNVYGFIYLTKEEKELLSTPYFQRLNHIRQLGLAYFVFPGAVHTRFSHSLGVLYIAEKMFQRLIKVGYANNLSEIEIKKHHKILRIAALLHDIGHYPLSHTLEASYKECSYFMDSSKINNSLQEEINENISKDKDSIEKPSIAANFKANMCSENINKLLYYFDKMKNIEDDKYHHEYFAEKVIHSKCFSNILKQQFDITDDDINVICNIINGTNKKSEFFIISKIIKSNLDADQLDYMIRDTQNTGINVNVDLDYIINNMYLCKRKLNGKDRQVICYSSKALPAIEQFLLAKYYWYSNILFYEKAYIANYIARRIFSYLIIEKKLNNYMSMENLEKTIEKPEEFFFFNDTFFWNQIKDIVSSPKQYSDIIVKLSKLLVNRKFPLLLDETTFNNIKKERGLPKEIQLQPSINLKKALKEKIQTFKTAFIEDDYIVPIPIEKNIIKISKNDEIGENKSYEKSSNDLSEEDQELIFLANEDINITFDKKRCTQIANNNQNQFLDLFYSKRTPKYLHMFRLYDFSNCLID